MAEGGVQTETAMDTKAIIKAPIEASKFIPQAEASAEQQRFTIPIVDTREQLFPEQTEALHKRLTEDNVDVALLQTRRFLGGYARQEARDLAIKIIPGEKIGTGQVTDRLIDMEMPTPTQIEEMRQQPHPAFGVLASKEYNTIVMASVASTVLHEGVHGLLDSRPDSQFATDLERISSITNQYGQVATLLDEGLAYAIQGMHAPSIEPIGRLMPDANPTDSFIIQSRKVLGERLRPIIVEYMAQSKPLDSEFLAQAGEMLKQIDIDRYIAEYQQREDAR